MNANYRSKDKERAFARLPASQQKMIREYMEDIAVERAALDRAEFVQLGIDLAVQQMLIVLIREFDFGTRKYAGKERMPKLLGMVNSELTEGLRKHQLDIDMFRFALHYELQQWGLDYPLSNLGKKENVG